MSFRLPFFIKRIANLTKIRPLEGSVAYKTPLSSGHLLLGIMIDFLQYVGEPEAC